MITTTTTTTATQRDAKDDVQNQKLQVKEKKWLGKAVCVLSYLTKHEVVILRVGYVASYIAIDVMFVQKRSS